MRKGRSQKNFAYGWKKRNGYLNKTEEFKESIKFSLVELRVEWFDV